MPISESDGLEVIAARMYRATDMAVAADLLRESGRVIGVSLPAFIEDVSGSAPHESLGRQLNSQFGWPAWMIDTWYDRAYIRQHPVYLRCRFDSMPFVICNESFWQAFDVLTTAQQQIRRDQGRYRLYGVLVVPIHLAFGRVAAAVWATQTPMDLDAVLDAHGHLLLTIAHSFAALALPSFSPRVGTADFVHFTDRQVDCLYWLANGKTIAETAVILDISPHTVREHLRVVTARLNAANTTHAIALACQYGIIPPLR